MNFLTLCPSNKLHDPVWNKFIIHIGFCQLLIQRPQNLPDLWANLNSSHFLKSASQRHSFPLHSIHPFSNILFLSSKTRKEFKKTPTNQKNPHKQTKQTLTPNKENLKLLRVRRKDWVLCQWQISHKETSNYFKIPLLGNGEFYSLWKSGCFFLAVWNSLLMLLNIFSWNFRNLTCMKMRVGIRHL